MKIKTNELTGAAPVREKRDHLHRSNRRSLGELHRNQADQIRRGKAGVNQQPDNH